MQIQQLQAIKSLLCQEQDCFLHMQIHIMKYGIVPNNIVP